MDAITYDKIKVESPWEIQSPYELRIIWELNKHAELHITALLKDTAAARAGLQETMDAQIKISIEEGDSKSWLFKGILKAMMVSVNGGSYVLKATFLSASCLLDRVQKSRSFQDTSKRYVDIVTQILTDYSGKKYELTAETPQIDGPLIQYKETDWQYINRLASCQEDVVVPNIILDEVLFSFGFPAAGVKTLPESTQYSIGKNITSFNVDWDCNSSIISNEYTYYEVETCEQLTIGDQITFQGIEMYVGGLIIELKDGILLYRAKLIRYATFRQNTSYNSKLKGASLEGTVLAVQDQEVKLHLSIDDAQDEGTAYWYPFVPPTTDMLYLMPQIGTQASLYIPRLREQEAIITGCVRTNGASCAKTSDPSTRYLGTEYGQELKLAPGGIYITAGRSNLVANFDDQEGVTLSSHKSLTLSAEQEIEIKSKQAVNLSATSKLLVFTPSAGISLENEIYIQADSKVYIDRTGGLDNERGTMSCSICIRSNTISS